jgi:hypothetical protein
MYMTRFSSEPLPTDWSTLPGSEEILFSSDIAVSPNSTLKAKVLVFRDLVALQRFWRLGLGRPKLADNVYAVVNDMTSTVTLQTPRGKPKPPPIWEVDPTYFCVAGFIIGKLNMECITHESVHAAYAYARRVAGRKTWPDNENPEEQVCYPAGRIAAVINRIFHRHGLYDRQSVSAWPVAKRKRRKPVRPENHQKKSATASKACKKESESEIEALRAKLEKKRREENIKYHGMTLLLDAGISTSNCFFMPIIEVFDFGSISPMSHAVAAKLRADIEAIKFPYSVSFNACDEIPGQK